MKKTPSYIHEKQINLYFWKYSFLNRLKLNDPPQPPLVQTAILKPRTERISPAKFHCMGLRGWSCKNDRTKANTIDLIGIIYLLRIQSIYDDLG